MRVLLGSFWRSVAYCLHPRVIALSLLPLILMVVGAFALGYWFWDQAVDAVLAWLESWSLVEFVLGWLDSVGLGALRAVVAPLLVLVMATPVIVVLALLLVAFFMTPAMVELVAQRRFPDLQRRRGGGLLGSIAWSVWSTVLALLMLVVSLPLWLIPPLVLVLPPLIWGWLTYRVFSYDALAEHASAEERRTLLARHRVPLLVMGVVAGLISAAPSVLWASGAMFIALAPLLVPLAIWVYALVFAFASLWYAHYLLQALDELRRADAAPAAPPSPPPYVVGDDGVVDVQARPLPPTSSS
ncbi:Etoposide-induced protein 2.4 (EI24) [Tepidimonas thermarum]|uniref:Etoposide-induced protein 2.4 (EI24) n=1 Tax=Tepidimonas thermarum TaxID=335431 RepID=A0A554X0V0_9BURK|nr:EI24 domain-containing protein [Tepidimonas thermarum]TSE29376.1 Etoposide-induced protein 2.4 (EI24) [Tepidimonas thermarum]